MDLSDVQDVESRILSQIKGWYVIKTERQNSINAPSVGLGCISVSKQVDRTPPLT